MVAVLILTLVASTMKPSMAWLLLVVALVYGCFGLYRGLGQYGVRPFLISCLIFAGLLVWLSMYAIPPRPKKAPPQEPGQKHFTAEGMSVGVNVPALRKVIEDSAAQTTIVKAEPPKPPKPITGKELKKPLLNLANDVTQWYQRKSAAAPQGPIYAPDVPRYLSEEGGVRLSEFWKQAAEEFHEKFDSRIIAVRNNLERYGVDVSEIDHRMVVMKNVEWTVTGFHWRLQVQAGKIQDDSTYHLVRRPSSSSTP